MQEKGRAPPAAERRLWGRRSRRIAGRSAWETMMYEADLLERTVLTQPPLAQPILSVSNLTTAFPTIDGDVLAVDDVSLSIRPGETLAVVGESGSGKSVTAKSILRLTDYQNAEIRQGEMLFRRRDGRTIDLARASSKELRSIRGNEISIIFQEPLTSLNPVMNVGDQIAEAIMLHQRKSRAEAMELALAQLRQVRIPEAAQRLAQYPHELSGGMRQRVMIAMALACRPQLLIADEPTTALDVTIQAQILSLIRDLQREIGMAVLFITHDMGVVAEIADRVVVMYRGQKVEEGPVGDIFAAPRHPYTRALLSAVPRLGSMAGKLRPEPFPRLLLDADGEAMGLETQPARPSASVHRLSYPDEEAGGEATPKIVLEVDRLVTRFPIRKGFLRRIVGNVHAVENVSFRLHAGETLALVGESGCGKSTIGRTILKLVEPTSGDIIINRRNVTNYSPVLMQPVRRHAQMIFQDPFASLNPRMTIADIIAEPLIIHDVCPRGELAERGARLLEKVGLTRAHLARYPHEFSGGQRQRIAIARALALEPSIIIADEAVSALDVSIQAQVVNLMMSLQEELGIAFLFISHDMAVVERAAHRVAVMYLGQIVEIGPRESVFARPHHSYTRRLMEAVPVADPARRRERALVTSEIPSPVKPVGFEPELRPLIEIAPGHFAQAED
jgi:glutathione transport system ATP-binding protein